MTSITFPSEIPLGDCPGVLDGDFTKTKKGLIVLHEWWGMNEQIQEQAKKIGMMGNFVTLVPDLYRGKVAIDREEADHLASDLDWSGAVADIRGAAEYLLKNGCTKVGATGFCNGGALSLMVAAVLPPAIIAAAAPFYGIPRDHRCDLSTITARPVQGHFGELDHIKGFSSLDAALALKDKLSGNENFELHIYKNCGHAFTNHASSSYDRENAELALSRMVDFMNKHLA